jgi:hypothetical protein
MDKTTRQTIQWTKQQDRQYNGQNNKTDNTMDKTTRQTIQWTKQQDRQYNGQNNKTDNAMDKTSFMSTIYVVECFLSDPVLLSSVMT